jgi:hypothetical protein
MDGTNVASEPASDASQDAVMLNSLPKEVGVLLIVVGLGGILLPGPVGSPFLILGGVVLFPKAFRRLDSSFQKHFPKLHREGLKQVHRFVVDLEKRYPYHT